MKSRKSQQWFRFVSDVDPDRLEAFRGELVKFYREVRTAFGASQSKHGVPVRIYARRCDYLEFYERTARASGEHVLGFYRRGDSDDGGMLCFFDDPYDNEQVLDTARHEATHLLIAQSLGEASLPIWLEEGLAVYMAGLQEDRVGPYTANAAVLVRTAIDAESAISFGELASVEDPSALHYAYAWTWVSFLLSTRKGEDRMRAYFTELKRRSDQTRSEERTPAGAEAEARALFAKMFNDLIDPKGWRDYVLQILVPKTVAQKLDYAKFALNLHLYDVSIPLSAAILNKRLEDADRWLREAAAESPELRVARRIQLASLLVVVLRSFDADNDAFFTSLWGVVTSLNELTDNAESADLLADIAGFAQEVGDFVRSSREASEEQDAARLRDESTPKEEIEAIREWRQNLDAISTAFDHLLRIACIRALTSDPIHRPAAHSWLFLTMRLGSRTDAQTLFPFLLLQVERDPSDYALAALAAVYRVLGHEQYASDMLERAKFQPGKRDLSIFDVAVSK